jgi:hypothetical protein
VRATFTASKTAAPTGSEALPSPANDSVTILRQEHIALKSAAIYWHTIHSKAVDRFLWRKRRYQRILRELKVSGAKSNASLQAEPDLAKGQIRNLQSRLFTVSGP